MNIKKSLSELTIKDGFMFFALMSNVDLCRELLELILDKKIEKVYVHQEDSLMYHPKFHGVRLDVIAIEQGTKRKFNVEMQAEKKDSLEKRSRYYHSQIDMDLLARGANYKELNETYVIFICDFDPFGKQLYRYTYQMQCIETGKPLNDGLFTVFLNSKGTVKDVDTSEKLVAFLNYVANPEREDAIADPFVSKIDKQIRSIRFNREWEAQYMLLRETLREEREDARLQGRIEGRAEGRAEGRVEGRAEGRAEGSTLKLIEQIQKKIKKGKNLSEIKNDLEDDSVLLETIFSLIHDPDCSDNITEIYQKLLTQK